jgi:hypothetical protein
MVQEPPNSVQHGIIDSGAGGPKFGDLHRTFWLQTPKIWWYRYETFIGISRGPDTVSQCRVSHNFPAIKQTTCPPSRTPGARKRGMTCAAGFGSCYCSTSCRRIPELQMKFFERQVTSRNNINWDCGHLESISPTL